MQARESVQHNFCPPGCHSARVAGQQPPSQASAAAASRLPALSWMDERSVVSPPPMALLCLRHSASNFLTLDKATFTVCLPLNYPPPHSINIPHSAMLRQAFSTSSRALRSAPRLAANQPMLRTRFQNAPAAWSSRTAQPVVARWYSDAKETPAEGDKAESEKAEPKEAAGESDALAEVKKNLEAKDAEARDWKVRQTRPRKLPGLSSPVICDL